MYTKQFKEEISRIEKTYDPGILNSIADDYFTKEGKPIWSKILWNLGILIARIFILIANTKNITPKNISSKKHPRQW